MRTPGRLFMAAAFAVGCSNDGAPTASGAEPQVEASASRAASGAAALQEDSPGLAARATISEAQARTIALQRVPGGQVVEAELEEEGETLLYSYDIRVAGRQGTVEVEVDARTGAVLSGAGGEDDGEDGAGER